jgi:nitrogen fixation protein FixH
MTQTLRGVHVLWILSGFFAAITVVNAVFIVKAVGTFPGEDAPKSYLQGLDYNSTLDRREAQRRAGWIAAVGFDDAATPALRVHLSSATGEPVRDQLDVVVRYRLAGDGQDDRVMPMTYLGLGDYAAAPGVLPPGRIEMIVEARRSEGAGIVFEARKTLATPG